MICLYLGNDKIKIIDCAKSKGKISVRNFYAITSPNDYLDNPDSKTFKELSQVIKDGLQELQPKGKRIRVVLDSNTIPYREMVLPSLKPQKLITLIKNEIFTDEKLAESNAVDFVEADKKVDEEKRSKFFITYVATQIIDDLQALCKEMGLRLLSIDVAQNAISKLIAKEKNLDEQFMLVNYKETSVTVFLFVYGKHIYSVTKPIISSPNPKFQNEKVYFINEMSGIILDTANFFRERYEGIKFNKVYVTGDVDKFALCLNPIEAKVGMSIKNLSGVDIVDDLTNEEFNQFADTIGAFLREGR